MNMFSLDRVISSSHAFRTFDKDYLINLGDGTAFVAKAGVVVPIVQYYQLIRTVFNSSHQIIARRKNISDVLEDVRRPKSHSSP